MRATTNSVKTLENFDIFRDAFHRGDRVNYKSPDGTCEVRPLYGLDMPALDQLQLALQYTHALLQASATRDRAGAAEWRDELEVLALHTDNPSIRKVCEGVIGAFLSR
ncbi:hypothetical protein Rleg2_4160 [Rhizobium leguminosarum bv. trifolii WSM2304]|uniref:Uncharacterized protein n=1 Tax=Rhizobium leguminosarum bv. trifolii (strain WSM2304) TaxID=395492 RepID=A0ABF7QT64_RHILW|nr:hypothetical protein [Rhizobium leguminosarum]ACI57422.1 hypothetical protein Rleg2_4160 [Rhizobium leguminosarum bv. trifolii WSM2304]